MKRYFPSVFNIPFIVIAYRNDRDERARPASESMMMLDDAPKHDRAIVNARDAPNLSHDRHAIAPPDLGGISASVARGSDGDCDLNAR